MQPRLLATAAFTLIATASTSMADRFILNWGGENNLLVDLVFVHLDGSVSHQGVDTSVEAFTELPPDTASTYYHDRTRCHKLCINFEKADFTAAMFEDPVSGLSLLPLYPTEPTSPNVVVGDMVDFTTGATPSLPGLLLREPGVAFPDITDAQFADTSVFPLFSGMAEVVQLVRINIDEPCECEIDGDYASVTIFDLLAYLQLWFAQDAEAERDGQPGVGIFDLLTFLDCWFPAATDGGLCEIE